MPKPRELSADLLDYIRKRNRFSKFIHKTATCWLWTGALNAKGYGLYAVANSVYGKRNLSAHRVSYALVHGPLLDDRSIDLPQLIERAMRTPFGEPEPPRPEGE